MALAHQERRTIKSANVPSERFAAPLLGCGRAFIERVG